METKKRTQLTILLFILFLAGGLRLCNLNQFPVGLNADEAAIGYNAYSLILTGRDEHGRFFPIHFKSFGDYKPGLYFYLVLPLVKILGLNVWAVRLPSAILGIFSVLLIYLLTQKLFQEEKLIVNHLSLIAAFFLAISPWHLHFSRGGWEVNVSTFFILSGVYLFLKSLSNPKWLVFCVLAFVLSFYTYHSARVVIPFFSLGLLFLFRKKILHQNNWKWVLISGIVGFIILIPLIIDFVGPAGVSRFAGVGLLADSGPLWRINELRGHHQNTMSLPVRLIHNRFLGYSIAFFKNWFEHFQGEFLFISGDVIERNRVPEMGEMYFFDIPLLLLGVYFLLKNQPRNWQIIFLWLGVAPLAAAMTFQAPHALRAHNMVIPLIIICAYGFCEIIDWVKNKCSKILQSIFWFMAFILIAWNIFYYLHQYYLHYAKTYPSAWEFGFEELVDYLKPKIDNYNKIYVTDRYDQPYILFLFFLKYPPEKFQKEIVLTPRDKFGFSTVRDFDKFHFESIQWENLDKQKNILIVGTDEEIPESARIIKEINFKNGKPAFQIAEL